MIDSELPTDLRRQSESLVQAPGLDGSGGAGTPAQPRKSQPADWSRPIAGWPAAVNALNGLRVPTLGRQASWPPRTSSEEPT